MSTDQNYDANAVSQGSFEQTAENTSQTAQNEGQQQNSNTAHSVDEPNDYFTYVAQSEDASESLIDLLSQVRELTQLISPIAVIVDICNDFISQQQTIGGDKKQIVQSLLGFTSSLLRLKSYYQTFSEEVEPFFIAKDNG